MPERHGHRGNRCRQAARVRSLCGFTREAADTGLLEPVVPGEAQARAVTPGLGWRAGT